VDRLAPAAAGVVAVLLVAGCGGGGEKPSSAPPSAQQTMRLTSTAFRDGGTIPTRFTCSGDGTAPPLAIANTPPKTRELALVVEDPDADNFVHWILLRIPPDTSTIGKPPGAVETKNSFDKRGWGAPCPPEGDEPHRYVFTIYALDAPLGLGEDASPNDVHDAIAKHALARGTLTGRFSR
jgi:Raf kinase inhibitor-like YbhB/YbcL family protein